LDTILVDIDTYHKTCTHDMHKMFCCTTSLLYK